jgi:ribosomal protein S18 acetylase RimI-like enzyme
MNKNITPIIPNIRYGMMLRRHLSQVIEIENCSSLECKSDPWTMKQFIDSMLNLDKKLYVITSGTEDVIGYIVTYKNLNVVYIENVVVNKDYRRMGYGTLLIEFVELNFKNSKIMCIIPETYLAATVMMRNLGYNFDGHFIEDDLYHYRFSKLT